MLFGAVHPTEEPTERPKRAARRSQGPAIAACASWLVTVAARLVEQRYEPSLYQAPAWLVLIGGLVALGGVYRAWPAGGPPVLSWVRTVSFVSLLPLIDLALPVPVTVLVATAVQSHRHRTTCLPLRQSLVICGPFAVTPNQDITQANALVAAAYQAANQANTAGNCGSPSSPPTPVSTLSP